MKSENAQKRACEPLEGLEPYRETDRGPRVNPGATSCEIEPVMGSLPCSFCGAGRACDNGRWSDGSDCEAMRGWQAQYFQRRAQAKADPWPLPPKFAAVELDPAHPTTGPAHAICARWIRQYLDGGTGNLVLVGPPGTGKSHAACATAATLAREQVCVAFAGNAKIMTEIRATYGKRYNQAEDDDESESSILDALEDVPVLVFDDLGRGGESEHAVATLFQIVDRRYTAARPMIVTTNIVGDSPRFHGKLGEDWSAIMGRVYDGATVVKMERGMRRPA